MALATQFRGGVIRFSARRHRRVLVASIITLATSAVLLGLLGVIRWRGRQAVRSDTGTIIAQTGQQLVRALQSRRGTLTFLRDTLSRQPDLPPASRQAMGASAVEHTRHLLGIGLVRGPTPPAWWAKPAGLSTASLGELTRAVSRRSRLRGTWRVSSTFVTTAVGRPLLIMLEPLRGATPREQALIGVFDLKPLLADFFAANLSQPYPVQVLDGDQVLYRIGDWSRPDGHASGGPRQRRGGPRPIIAKHAVAVDAARWLLQMQPGSTSVARTLSWLNALVVVLGALAGLGITVIVWILAARAWLLQRAVDRRTAALRRASARLRELAIRDELTGLYNRRFFLERFEWECKRAKRYRRPFACLMVDLNGFKQVNDRLGHQAGDFVLKQVAQELSALLRQSDVLARFGGDEFVIALPETTPAQAEAVAEKLRGIRVEAPSGSVRSVDTVTLSVGMSRLEPERESPRELLEAADRSLYAWKARVKSTKRDAAATHTPT
jgi:diguanylate cyclase (GGDEF)-like protein